MIICLRRRADNLQISREAISEIAGLPDRYASKLLSVKKVRRLGLESLGPLLGALGLRLVAIPDEAAMARNAAEYGARDEAHLKSAMARWEAPAGKPTWRSRKAASMRNLGEPSGQASR